jgi:hypothetical protein
MIRACLEPANNVVFCIACGDNENRCGSLLHSQRGDDLHAVPDRQAKVKDNSIEIVASGEIQASLAIGSRHRGVAHLAEPFTKQLEHARIVFDDQDALFDGVNHERIESVLRGIDNTAWEGENFRTFHQFFTEYSADGLFRVRRAHLRNYSLVREQLFTREGESGDKSYQCWHPKVPRETKTWAYRRTMFKNFARFVLFLVVVLAPVALHATDGAAPGPGATGSITGTVKDATGSVLQGARIVIEPTSTRVASDAQGNFVIPNVKPGSYTLTISYIGFQDSVSSVLVSDGKNSVLNAVLTVNSSNQQVEVIANLTGDAAAINETRTSENILNVMSDHQIQSLPNANIADAVGRLPGVTLQRNEGEGQYVQIRGTEPRLSNTTIDGVIVPGPDPQVRQVDLDTIPADLVGSVAINKTLSANQDGDAIGGSVDLRIKQATRDAPTLSIGGWGGYTPIADGRKTFTISSSAGFRFGPSSNGGQKKLGIELGYSYDYNGRGIDDVEPDPTLDQNGNKDFDELYIQQYLYDRTRYGFAGAADYKLTSNSDLYVHGLFSNFRDYGQKFAYQLKEQAKSSYHTSVRRPKLANC